MRKRKKWIFISFIILLAIIVLNYIGLYDFERSVARGDVVNLHGQIYNHASLESFAANVESRKSDKIRIVNYTIEGDPIIMDLKYSDNIIKIKINNFRDKHGSHRLIHTKATCKELVKKGDAATEYWLDDCNHNIDEQGYLLLTVSDLNDP